MSRRNSKKKGGNRGSVETRFDRLAGCADRQIRTLKHRILKKHRQLTHEALLINEVLDKL
jgi:hypothetical protein